MAESLLQTKLFVQPLRPLRVSRSHLIDRLNQGRHGKLTLVSAAAGFGKTTLVTEWIHQLSEPVSWLSLDASDSLPERFLLYLAAALRRVGIDWQPESDADPLSLVNALAARKDPFVLVLDDYHTIEAATVHQFVAYLLAHAPPWFHLVITSRTDPPLSLSRLYARNEVNEIRTLDLLFDEGETATFFNQLHGLDLPARVMQQLLARTEGWIAGLQLAALSLRRLPTEERHRFAATFAGDDRYILDYLISEVLQQQTAERYTFLLQTSLLSDLSADLCAAVTGGSRRAAQRMLEELEKENLFVIPLDNRRHWYRYHHLFADLLRGRLRSEAADLEAVLHRKASAWYAAQQRVEAALHHSLAANDFEQVAQLLETPDLLRHLLPDQILEWLGRLPLPVFTRFPRLAIQRLWLLLADNDLQGAADQLRALAEPIAADPQLRLESLVIEIQLAQRRHDNARAIELGHALLAALPPRHTPESLSVQIGGLFGLGEAYRSAGELDAAVEQFQETIRISKLAGNQGFQLRGKLALAQVLIARQQWHSARLTLESVLSGSPVNHQAEIEMAQQLMGEIREHLAADQPVDMPDPLTPRELDVLRLLDSHLSTAEIGEQLFVSTNTVKTHLKRLYAKLGARSRFEAVAAAKARNLL